MPGEPNPVATWIPVARITDLLERTEETTTFDGQTLFLPDTRLVYWAGGNPFHHHQDLNRLVAAWQRPETVIVHEQAWNPLARRADLVFPVTTTLERDDIGTAPLTGALVAMPRLLDPPGEARDDYAVFAGLAERLGVADRFTAGLDTMAGWTACGPNRHAGPAPRASTCPPSRSCGARAWSSCPGPPGPGCCWATSGPTPRPIRWPRRAAASSCGRTRWPATTCPTARPTPPGSSPRSGWAQPGPSGSRCTCCRTSRRTGCTASSTTAATSLAGKVAGRAPVQLHPADAAARGIADGDVVRLYNDRGACLAGAVLEDGLRPGVVVLATGAWYDPLDPAVPGSLDVHGNPNVLTSARPASSLSGGPAPGSCLVEVERWDGPVPPVRAFDPPPFVEDPRPG